MKYKGIPKILKRLEVYRLDSREICAEKWSLVFTWGFTFLITKGSSWAGDDYYRLVILSIWGLWEFVLPFKSNIPVLLNMPCYGIRLILGKLWVFYGATSNKYEYRPQYFILFE